MNTIKHYYPSFDDRTFLTAIVVCLAIARPLAALADKRYDNVARRSYRSQFQGDSLKYTVEPGCPLFSKHRYEVKDKQYDQRLKVHPHRYSLFPA